MTRGRTVVILLAAGGVIGVLAANAHLIYLAVTSQPECVAHDGAAYAPAKSSC